MKKLIVFSVVFALVAGAGLFAADVSATYFGHVVVINAAGDKDGDDAAIIENGGGFDRLRFEANHDGGNFGAYLRYSPLDGTPIEGLGWWKPIDQFKLNIGKFSDGMYGKEGWAGWMFYQMPSDCGMVNPHSVWGGGYFNPNWEGAHAYRDAFFGGYDINGLSMEIMPADIFNLVIGLPFFDGGQLVKDTIGNIMIQGNLNLDFGNIALTYWGAKGVSSVKGGGNDKEADFDHTGKLYLSTSIGAIENVGIDFGVGFPIPGGDADAKFVDQDDISVSLGAKIDVSDAFGIKVRLLTEFGGQQTADGDAFAKNPFFLGADLLPFFAINDDMKLFVGLGMVYVGADQNCTGPNEFEDVENTGRFGWHLNPYVQVGSEWGPCIYFGFNVYSHGNNKDNPAAFDMDADGNAKIHFEVPIGIQVSY